ncbi:YpjP family protein [Peribacillus sp. SCS-155]|uniref:YpjP family protein n=1 Tax=Peribacillus sedimenti TaxID=3115297 RepID=UPI003905C24A
MKKVNWWKKSLVVLISILTFGLVTPSDFDWFAEAQTPKNAKKDSIQDSHLSQTYQSGENKSLFESEIFDSGHFIYTMKMKAEENSYRKFGEKIKPKIEDEFRNVILPKMEEAIENIAAEYPEKNVSRLAISTKPSIGRGEKIFHIYNEDTKEDVIRFHVRQENPPQQGYWFNFHYHTYHDGFIAHHELGRIYWDKNTPPAWGGTGIIS